MELPAWLLTQMDRCVPLPVYVFFDGFLQFTPNWNANSLQPLLAPLGSFLEFLSCLILFQACGIDTQLSAGSSLGSPSPTICLKTSIKGQV
jgi:hypothetical protein